MCGIVTLIDPAGAQTDALKKMVSAIGRRGPDDQGFYTAGPAGLAMCRLSIVDLSGGHQPISNEDGTLTLVCNGEIYNHLEVREELVRKGHRFKTHSDVEIILHLYEEYGDDCVHHLRGMYGFALWDDKKKRLLAGRDRLGIKPLFFAEVNGALLVGSEIKALLATGLIPRDIDWTAMADYFTLGYIPAPHSVFNGIRRLKPGHTLTWENGKTEERPYWRLRFAPDESIGEKEALEKFEHLMREAIRMHLMADVPLGAFLSGGIDSGLIVALMAEYAEGRVNTFTLGFGGNTGTYWDERAYARMVSQRYNTTHTEFQVEPHIDEILDPIAEAFDEPFADDSVIPSYYICQLTRQKVKVAMTGLGGDELFGGYERYLGLSWSGIYSGLPAGLRGVIRPFVEALPDSKKGSQRLDHLKRFVRSGDLPPARRYLDYVTVFNRDLGQSILAGAARERWREGVHTHALTAHFDVDPGLDLLHKAVSFDAQTYLPDDILALSDRLSMWHSLELRVPFLDHEVVEYAARIPASLKIRGTTKKYLLKQMAKKYLPGPLINHRKQGFASPMTSWLRTDLRGYVRDTLAPDRLTRQGILNGDAVGRLMDDHFAGRGAYNRHIFTLLMFQKWHDLYMKG